MKIKYFYLLMLFTAFILGVTACSSSDTASDTVVNDDDTFVIGIDDHYPPLGYMDEEGNIIGFDIDLARETARRLGMDLEIVPIDWQEKDEILESGQIDAIWSGLSITPEREAIYAFSDPYLDLESVIVVRDDSEIASVTDLKDKVVGVQDGSYAYDILHSLPIYSEIDHETLFEENVSGLKNLYVGLTDAVIVDSALANWYITKYDSDYKIVDSISDIEVGVAFLKDNEELRDQVNTVLEDMIQDGTAQRISEEWFGSDLITFD